MKLPNITQVIIFIELICKKLLTALQVNYIINNIVNKHSFSLRIFESSKYNEKIEEYIHIKKTIHLKNETIFDFMIHPLNNESEVIKNLLLDIIKLKVKKV